MNHSVLLLQKQFLSKDLNEINQAWNKPSEIGTVLQAGKMK